MDEMVVYFEDARTQTVDLEGRRHVVIEFMGFASMRVTVVAAVLADGRKEPPLLIEKGNDTNNLTRKKWLVDMLSKEGMGKCRFTNQVCD